MGLSPGDRVDRYEVIALLGTGGMGEVYRARDPKLARLVALKILRVPSGPGTDGAARLLREARAAAALSHANVLAVYDVGEVQEPESLRGLAYIAMELVVGRSLRSYVGDASIPLDRRVRWLRDAASALGAAHREGIVHRDVKPENVMIRFDDVVKVLDFGIARRQGPAFDAWSSTEGHSLPTAGTGPAGVSFSAERGALVGTPFYMAPEQLRGETLDGRADQFAWGVMAYMLVAGELPWKATAEPLGVLSQILSSNPAPPREVDARIPVALSDVIVRALSKPREERFASMEELLRALDGASAATPPVPGQDDPRLAAPDPSARAEPPASPAFTTLADPQRTTAPRAPAPAPRGRWLRLGAAIAVAVGAASALLAWQARRATPAPSGSRGSSAAPVVAGECSSNRECVQTHGGEAWHCHTQRHACVELASTDCKVYADAQVAVADDAVWLGGMFPLSTNPRILPEMRGTDLARQDFATALGPSAGRTGALHARPIGLVICDEGVDALRAAHHLTDDVEVPAAIGFLSSASALTTIPTVFLPAHALSFVSISQAPAITKIPEPEGEPRLVWRSTLNRDAYAAPLAHLISDVLEPSARRGPLGIGNRPFKVAVVWAKASNPDTMESLFRKLRFNGRSALENGADFRQFAYEGKGDTQAEDVIAELLTFAPNVIVYAADAFVSKILVPLETRWAGGPRPFYLTAQGVAPDAVRFAGRDPARRRRFFAVTNLSTTMTNAQLVLRYNLAFPAEPTERSDAPQPSYDAFYVLAYATYALGNGPVTGPALSGAIQRLLPPGRKVDVGPGQILEAFETLRSNGSTGRIDLSGAIGSLDFDPATGEAPIDYAIICPGVDDTGAASAPIDSGLVYDARAQKLVGTLRCP